MHSIFQIQQSGFSILETIIALALLVTTITGGITFYAHTQTNAQFLLKDHQQLNRADGAFLALKSAIDKTGYSGCAGVYSSARSKWRSTQFPPAFSIKQMNTTTWRPAINEKFNAIFKHDTSVEGDEIVVQTSANEARIVRIINQNTLQLNQSDAFTVGDWLWLSNCQFTRLSQIAAINDNHIIHVHNTIWQQQDTAPIEFDLVAGDAVYQLAWQHFYIKGDPNNLQKPTLYKKHGHHPAVPMIADIHKIAFTENEKRNAITMQIQTANSDKSHYPQTNQGEQNTPINSKQFDYLFIVKNRK